MYVKRFFATAVLLSSIAHFRHKVIKGVEEHGSHWSLAVIIEEGIVLGWHWSFITAETCR